tara:strand:+ start:976 stop:1533 length:558 start_codon:yes stop_codon:yes gene_type:complete
MDKILMTIKPSIKKVLLFNLSKIVGLVLVVLGIGLYLNYLGSLGAFAESLEALGIEVDAGMLLFWLVVAVAVTTSVILLISYLGLRRTEYVFYDDTLLVNDKEELPYKNIVKISYDDTGVVNQMLGTGSMSIELTGMKEGKTKMEFIENVKKVTNDFQNLLRDYRVALYAQHHEKQRIGNILDKF